MWLHIINFVESIHQCVMCTNFGIASAIRNLHCSWAAYYSWPLLLLARDTGHCCTIINGTPSHSQHETTASIVHYIIPWPIQRRAGSAPYLVNYMWCSLCIARQAMAAMRTPSRPSSTLPFPPTNLPYPHYLKLTGNNTIHLALTAGIHLLSEYCVYDTVRPIILWLAWGVGRATTSVQLVRRAWPTVRLGEISGK